MPRLSSEGLYAVMDADALNASSSRDTRELHLLHAFRRFGLASRIVFGICYICFIEDAIDKKFHICAYYSGEKRLVFRMT